MPVLNMVADSAIFKRTYTVRDMSSESAYAYFSAKKWRNLIRVPFVGNSKTWDAQWLSIFDGNLDNVPFFL